MIASGQLNQVRSNTKQCNSYLKRKKSYVGILMVTAFKIILSLKIKGWIKLTFLYAGI